MKLPCQCKITMNTNHHHDVCWLTDATLLHKSHPRCICTSNALNKVCTKYFQHKFRTRGKQPAQTPCCLSDLFQPSTDQAGCVVAAHEVVLPAALCKSSQSVQCRGREQCTQEPTKGPKIRLPKLMQTALRPKYTKSTSGSTHLCFCACKAMHHSWRKPVLKLVQDGTQVLVGL